eukprot:TRINITY_DN385_c5_g1_i1.p1 TRINITY_DN385_c5_g1~~TRINITY_DN385_c5_g1_i1.p1  ORF type:complete len:371 (+),score=90.47 TRINITY_DN385_c5_g1_i1:30-1115(+)
MRCCVFCITKRTLTIRMTSASTISPSTTRIGWIGTGVMGYPMAAHLLTAGYRVSLFSRTKSKVQKLLDSFPKQTTWLNDPKSVAEQNDVVFTMVGYPKDVREVYLNKEHGLISGAHKGLVLVDMTTTEPSLAKEIYSSFQPKSAETIDAPVSGGDVGARNATLAIMTGGNKQAVEMVMPLFKLLGKNIVHQGVAGSGQHTKMCNQIVIASTMVGCCESLLYGYKAGLDLDTMLSCINKGAAGCWTLDNLCPRILKRNFDPGFFVEHFIKDMGIALDEAKKMNLCLPGLSLAHQLYLAVQAQGFGKCGTHALMRALESMSNTQVLVSKPVTSVSSTSSSSSSTSVSSSSSSSSSSATTTSKP